MEAGLVLPTKTLRRQKLDEEYQPLLDEGDIILCFFGSSLITVIFGVQTIVDATLFFISGGHKRYRFTPSEESERLGILDVHFGEPRIPSFFAHLLPGSADTGSNQQQDESRQQRARKRCAFFNIVVSRRGRTATEPPIVQLSADVKLFHYTVHVCGLRDLKDADMVMSIIHDAFIDNQNSLSSQKDLTELAGGNAERLSFLESNNRCCTIPLIISEGDVVMTNSCGRFPHTLNLRATYHILTERYPGVLAYLTTMSKSNYLAITLFEHSPFNPILTIEEMSPEMREELKSARAEYLISSKKSRSKLRKHTFFIYASGRFIQSSRNNATALQYTATCMKLLHTVSSGLEVEIIPDEDEEEDEEVISEADD